MEDKIRSFISIAYSTIFSQTQPPSCLKLVLEIQTEKRSGGCRSHREYHWLGAAVLTVHLPSHRGLSFPTVGTDNQVGCLPKLSSKGETPVVEWTTVL